MVQVSYPGVYIQEVPSGVHTITGVSTSIATFLGRATKGPINQPVRLLSLADYERNFGSPDPRSDLADSVRLFFTNGGTDCYVVRLAKGADTAKVALHSQGGLPVLAAEAKMAGVWADTVRLVVDYNTPTPDETFNLSVLQEEGGRVVATEQFTNLTMKPGAPRFAPSFVTDNSALITLSLHSSMGDLSDPGAFIKDLANSFAGFSQSRRPLGLVADVRTTLQDLLTAPGSSASFTFEIGVNGGAFVPVVLTPWPDVGTATIAQIEGHFQSRINAGLAMVTPAETVTCELVTVGNLRNMLTITADSGDQSSVRVRRAPSNDIAAALMLGVDQGGIEPARWSNFRPAPNGAFLLFGDIPPGGNQLGDLNAISDLDQNAITAITIDGTAIPLDGTNGYDLVTTADGDDWFVSAPISGSPHGDNDGVREKLRIMALAINNTPGLKWRAEVRGYHLALLATEGEINATPSVATGVAAFDDALAFNTRRYSLGTTSTSAFVSEQAGGNDGTAPGVAEYLGNPTDQTGFHALDTVDLFNLMVIPGDEEVGQTVMNQIWGPASVYCQSRRAFLLIDPPRDWTGSDGRPAVVQDTVKANDLRSLVVKDHSAVFYPRLRYSSAGTIRTIGPAGVIAGLMARIDSTRGVWKAAAGTEADLRGILGLEVNLTDMENGVLNKLGVNCLRTFPSGFVSWGARTLDGSDDIGSEWKYIPIRRLALFLAESLYRGTKWAVFQANDEPLWADIRLNLNAFMMGLFRQGAFQGSTPNDAFFVKCDAETTTQADRNLGIVNIIVGFAPLKPAEFVVIKIQQIVGDL